MATVLAKLGAWTPAQIAALVFGVWWIGNGITVFLATHPSPLSQRSGQTARSTLSASRLRSMDGTVSTLTTGLAQSNSTSRKPLRV